MLSPSQQELLKKLPTGLCTEEELEAIFLLVKQLPEAQAKQVLEDLWRYSQFQQTMPAASWAKIEQRIGQSERDRSGLRSRTKLLPWLAAASIILLLVAGGIAFFGRMSTTTTTTAFAEQKVITLPDGSTVWLNANSSLSFPNNWDEREDRVVTLEGEAFFRVRPKPATGQKFLVRTPDLTVSVLGTVFNVNSRDDKTSVFLEEGQVALALNTRSSEAKMMVPGELVTYSAKRQQLLADVKQVAPEVHTSWKDGVLIFDDTPLVEVLTKVENIYGISFEVADAAMYERRITAGLPMEEITLVLPLLEQVLGSDIEEQDGAYRITD
ncbi:FecR family protein [Neolewinella xylanilytica]|uniref:FecR family protein n=1 Tax=Neolewinella xylanilytica TaxID=1514080 RepID=A0A2S6I1I9_9BACT|nr:FecR domain-containing protein [Neolewinella xylanilytica]PPK85047.1 FecR family protein [Neolewinella xylanilytica]